MSNLTFFFITLILKPRIAFRNALELLNSRSLFKNIFKSQGSSLNISERLEAEDLERKKIAMFLWKNMLTIIGNVNSIGVLLLLLLLFENKNKKTKIKKKQQNPSTHGTAIICLRDVWKELAKVSNYFILFYFYFINFCSLNYFKTRDRGMKIPFKNQPVPPLYEFTNWFFQACELPESHFLFFSFFFLKRKNIEIINFVITLGVTYREKLKLMGLFVV